jgi:NAD(P)H-flavin reductase
MRAVVVRNEPAGVGLRWLTFDRPVADHRVAGQYVTVTPSGHPPVFFALASAPGAPMELLVKMDGEPAIAVGSSAPGDTIDVSPAQGSGFALDRVSGYDLVFLVNGSGLSAARPTLDAARRDSKPRRIFLYYGVFTPEHRSFLADLERWGNEGVFVRTVVGRPEGTGWAGATGFVQDVAEADGRLTAGIGAVLVGVPAMVDDARRRLRAAGVPDDRVLLNF